MTKSRRPLRVCIAFAWLAAPALLCAQPITPDEAIARQQEAVRDVVTQVCAPAAGPNEVIVCGRRRPGSRGLSDYRVPPSSPRPGEVGSGSGLEAMVAGGCLRLCPQPVVMPLLTIGFGGPGGARRTAIDEIREALGDRPD